MAKKDGHEILQGKGDLNRWVKQVLPRVVNNDPNLTCLKFNLKHLIVPATSRLIKALKFNTTLTSLDLSSAQIGDHQVAQLSEVLKTNFSLVSLNIQRNTITDLGAESLVAALEINSTLRRLDLSGNRIGDEGMMSFRDVLIRNQSLTFLNFHSSFRNLNSICVVGLKDNWIIRKNQTLYDLYFNFIFNLN